MSNNNTNREVITLNDDEYENFLLNKEAQGKTGQMLGYLAFKKCRLIEKPKKVVNQKEENKYRHKD